jgi:hypothetical protein
LAVGSGVGTARRGIGGVLSTAAAWYGASASAGASASIPRVDRAWAGGVVGRWACAIRWPAAEWLVISGRGDVLLRLARGSDIGTIDVYVDDLESTQGGDNLGPDSGAYSNVVRPIPLRCLLGIVDVK